MTDSGERPDDFGRIDDFLLPTACNEWVDPTRNPTGRRKPELDPTSSLSATRGPEPPPLAGDGGCPRSRLTAREVDGELVVVADLEGVDRNDDRTEIDLDDDSVVLSVDGRMMWRIPVKRRPNSIAGVTLNDDVLSFRVDVE